MLHVLGPWSRGPTFLVAALVPTASSGGCGPAGPEGSDRPAIYPRALSGPRRRSAEPQGLVGGRPGPARFPLYFAAARVTLIGSFDCGAWCSTRIRGATLEGTQAPRVPDLSRLLHRPSGSLLGPSPTVSDLSSRRRLSFGRVNSKKVTSAFLWRTGDTSVVVFAHALLVVPVTAVLRVVELHRRGAGKDEVA